MNDLNPTTPRWRDLSPAQKGAAIRPLITDQLLTYAQIAKHLGTTRSAVAAAADRHNITSPLTRGHTGEIGSKGATANKARTPRTPPKTRPRSDRPRFSRIAPVQPVAMPDDFKDKTPIRKGAWLPLPGTTPRPVHDHAERQCRWPVGPDDGPMLFCCSTALEGKVYCAQHVALAYKPRPEIRKGTAA